MSLYAIDDLIRDLGSDTEAVRRQAIDILSSYGNFLDSLLFSQLFTTMSGLNQHSRSGALEVLGNFGPEAIRFAMNEWRCAQLRDKMHTTVKCISIIGNVVEKDYDAKGTSKYIETVPLLLDVFSFGKPESVVCAAHKNKVVHTVLPTIGPDAIPFILDAYAQRPDIDYIFAVLNIARRYADDIRVIDLVPRLIEVFGGTPVPSDTPGAEIFKGWIQNLFSVLGVRVLPALSTVLEKSENPLIKEAARDAIAAIANEKLNNSVVIKTLEELAAKGIYVRSPVEAGTYLNKPQLPSFPASPAVRGQLTALNPKPPPVRNRGNKI